MYYIGTKITTTAGENGKVFYCGLNIGKNDKHSKGCRKKTRKNESALGIVVRNNFCLDSSQLFGSSGVTQF